MTETITEIAQRFVSENENWYIDTYDSYTEVGMKNKQSFGGFLAALDDRSIEYRIDQADSEKYIVEVY